METKKIFIAVILIMILGLFVTATTGTNNFEAPSTKENIEESLEVEEWMNQPFYDSLDEPLELEDWMTKPFIQ